MDNAGHVSEGDGIGDQFTRSVLDWFEPLLCERGFVVENSSSGSVVFRSEAVEVSIVLEPMSYAIGLYLAARGHPEGLVGLGDVVDADLGLGHTKQTFFQASTRAGMEIALEKMAGLVAEHCGGVLAGDKEEFRRILAAGRLRDEAYTARIVADPIRKEADEAWKRRDYGRVIALYGAIEAGLTVIETRRLVYARKCV